VVAPLTSHHVLAKIDRNKLVSWGEAARQPVAGPVCQPTAGDTTDTTNTQAVRHHVLARIDPQQVG